MFLYFIFNVNYILMKYDNKEIKKNEAFSKKRGPLIIISGGGGGPLQIAPFLLDKIFAQIWDWKKNLTGRLCLAKFNKIQPI